MNLFNKNYKCEEIIKKTFSNSFKNKKNTIFSIKLFGDQNSKSKDDELKEQSQKQNNSNLNSPFKEKFAKIYYKLINKLNQITNNSNSNQKFESSSKIHPKSLEEDSTSCDLLKKKSNLEHPNIYESEPIAIYSREKNENINKADVGEKLIGGTKEGASLHMANKRRGSSSTYNIESKSHGSSGISTNQSGSHSSYGGGSSKKY